MFSIFLNFECSSERRKELENLMLKTWEENPYLIGGSSGEMRDEIYAHIYTPEEIALHECPTLIRFVKAHNDSVRGFDCAIEEVKSGHKISHWIWYIFPQMKGLGHSKMSNYYGITSREEATAYLKHPLLREHLIEMAKAIIDNDNTVYEIFGNDVIKVRSCFKLFNSIEEIPEIKKIINLYHWL